MAVKANRSDEKVTNERTLYTGPKLVTVVAINPTLTKLNELGYNFEKEPEYLSETDEGVGRVEIAFYVKGDPLSGVVRYYLENREKPESKNTPGMFEFINNSAQSTWAVNVEEALERTNARTGKRWFDESGARRSMPWEAAFYNFIKFWCNVAPGEDCTLEDISKLFKGDFSELQGILKMYPANQLWVMATVASNEKGTFQNIYNLCFGRAISKQFATAFTNYANKQSRDGYAIKDTWSTEFKEYVPKPVIEPDPDPAKAEEDVAF